MEVSMLGLLRLSLLSVLLGMALMALPLVLMLFRLVLLPAHGELSLPPYYRLPKTAASYLTVGDYRFPKFFRHVFDFFFAVTVAVSFLVFFYAVNDGIPRLVAFVCAGGGAYILFRVRGWIVGRFFSPLAARVRYILLLLASPFLFVLLNVGKGFLRFLRNAVFVLIKSIKRIYTIHTSRRYVGKMLSRRVFGRRLRRISDAIKRHEEGEGNVH